MDNEDCASKSILRGNDAFVKKLLSACPSIEQSSRHSYFSDNQGLVPFIWEDEPGRPKYPTTMDFVPRIIPPPRLKPLHGPKPSTAQPRSCFVMKPWRASKTKKKDQIVLMKGKKHDAPDQSTASSKGFFRVAKRILRRLF